MMINYNKNKDDSERSKSHKTSSGDVCEETFKNGTGIMIGVVGTRTAISSNLDNIKNKITEYINI